MTAKEKALHFIEKETAFHLGDLVTEQSHPLTADLSEVIRDSLDGGILSILEVDNDIISMAKAVFDSDEYLKLQSSLLKSLRAGNNIYFTGCGATGRLSILLESLWRKSWKDLRSGHEVIRTKVPDFGNRAFSVMAGGDFALIKSVEGFEDFTDFGKHQIEDLGLTKGDTVIAITEGGETSFVIGTAWSGVAHEADVYFVYNNPTDVLAKHVVRSREVIEDSRIVKLDLATGPMAIAGSTRMQATTAELLIVGSALESVLNELLMEYLSEAELKECGLAVVDTSAVDSFVKLLADLQSPESIKAIGDAVKFEKEIYEKGGIVTYAADDYLLDILTDTTERSPTFSLPSFRPQGDQRSPLPWFFVKNPRIKTLETWERMLQRGIRGLDWGTKRYEAMGVPKAMLEDPPSLGSGAIAEFRIGNEKDNSRWSKSPSSLIMVSVSDELEGCGDLMENFIKASCDYKQWAIICLGKYEKSIISKNMFVIESSFTKTRLNLWEHLAMKLVLNTLSTATMVAMGRVEGNWMMHVQATNKKLIDRSTRLVSQLGGISYKEACIAVHESMEEIENRAQGEIKLSPAAHALKKLKTKE